MSTSAASLPLRLVLLLGLGCQPAAVPPAVVVEPVVRPVTTISAESPQEADSAASAEPVDEWTQSKRELAIFALASLQVQRVSMLNERSVQRELQLSDAQKAAVKKFKETLESTQQDLLLLRPENQREVLEDQFEPLATRISSEIDELLTPVQQEQLFRRVIRRQNGAIVFLLPGCAERMDLTEEQVDTFYRIVDESRRAINWDALPSPIEIARIMLRATAARKKAELMLTEEQSARWAELRAD
jgi:hypothetical protein